MDLDWRRILNEGSCTNWSSFTSHREVDDIPIFQKRESLRQSWMIMLRMRKMSSCMLLILGAPSAGTKKERLAETQFLLLDSLPFTGVDRFSTIIHQNLGDLSNNGQSFNWPFILLGTLQIVWCALTSPVLQGTYEIHSIIPSFYW